MSDNKFRNLIMISSAVVFAIVVIPFLWNFYNYNISNNLEKWGQFGDYIGGVLNPIVAVMNLAVFAYLSVKLVKIEEDRNNSNLRELARPLGHTITFSDNINYTLEITLTNAGLGPMKITKLDITDEHGNIIKDFNSHLMNYMEHNKISGNFTIQFLSTTAGILKKDGDWSILKFYFIKSTDDITTKYNNLKKLLNTYSMTFSYSDIYDKKIEDVKEKINLP